MTRIDKLVATALCAILLFLAYTVRLRERLSCMAADSGRALDCERVQTKLLASRDDHVQIPDPTSIALHLSSLTTASHTAIMTSAIQARDATGRSVILLSVPERDPAYARDLVARLRDSGSSTRPVTFERDESGSLWLLLIGTAGLTCLYVMLLRFRNRTRSVEHAPRST